MVEKYDNFWNKAGAIIIIFTILFIAIWVIYIMWTSGVVPNLFA